MTTTQARFRDLASGVHFALLEFGDPHAACEAESLKIMGSQPGDGIDRPRIDDLETAALREQATGVLAAYHQIELAEAGMLLIVLAEYLDCSVDAFAAEVLRTAVTAGINEPPRSGDFSPERSGAPE